MERDELVRRLVEIQYDRNDIEFERGSFRVRGDVVEIFPAGYDKSALRVEFFGDEIDRISDIDVVSGHSPDGSRTRRRLPRDALCHAARSHRPRHRAISSMTSTCASEEFKDRRQAARSAAHRTAHAVRHRNAARDRATARASKTIPAILTAASPATRRIPCWITFRRIIVVFVDESHVTLPQIRAMYNGDRARKEALVDYGFRLPSAFDNRPLRFEEFEQRIGQLICVCATPARLRAGARGAGRRADHPPDRPARSRNRRSPRHRDRWTICYAEIVKTTGEGYRVLVTTLTKKMAESLTDLSGRT